MSGVSDQLLREILDELRKLNAQQSVIVKGQQSLLDEATAICHHNNVKDGWCQGCGRAA